LAWTALAAVIGVLLLAVAGVLLRRAEVRRMADTFGELAVAKERGSHRAQLQYPQIDLSACIGCGACVRACPEDGVLGLVHGQAAVIHGARCVGHGLCASACPVSAIRVTLGDVSRRDDIPVLTDQLEAHGVPGLFLAGEVTGYALIRTAIAHGAAVAAEVACRIGAPAARAVPARPRAVRATIGGGGPAAPDRDAAAEQPADVLDLCIVGAGPSGIACSLGAQERGLRFLTLEQEELGGTVAKYPRRKLVMTQPVELPLHGVIDRTQMEKEELVQLWRSLVHGHRLPIRTGEELVALHRDEAGVFTVETRRHRYRARHVCLALGRRGTPRKLGVPGEELPKVAYGLVDAQSYQRRRILVVGGGDSAVEAALGLAAQRGNEVTLSYRKAAFFRLKARNESNLREAVAARRLRVVYESDVKRIERDRVVLEIQREGAPPQVQELANDDVFVLAGGVAPFKLLGQAGVSFDPALRPAAEAGVAQGPGLLRALCVGLALALAALLWVAAFRGYYTAAPRERALSAQHELLRPSGPLGLSFAFGACLLIVANLLYLLRRSRFGKWIAGSLQDWLSCHVVTGVLALLLAALHGAMAPRSTIGGHAFLCLCVLVATGAVGRYFYSFVPKAANGRDLALEEVQARLAALSSEWDVAARGFGQRVRDAMQELVARRHWQRTFAQRVAGLLTDRLRVVAALRRLRALGRAEGIPKPQLARILHLVKRAQRIAQAAAHYEDLRGLLASWRFLHRWVAAVMVFLIVLHVAVALRYGEVF
jgi:thioredoxin reductase